MDLRRFDLLGKEVKDLTAYTLNDFQLPAETRNLLVSQLPILDGLDFWSPEFQAWSPFVLKYLRSSGDTEVAKQWGIRILDKDSDIYPIRNRLSGIYDDITRITRENTTELFSCVDYSEIQIMSTIGSTYMQSKKDIMSIIYSEETYSYLLEELLKSDEGSMLMRAVYLYKHRDIGAGRWSQSETAALYERVSQWLELFLQSFDLVVEIVEPLHLYSWYTPNIRVGILRAWDHLFKEDAPIPFDKADLDLIPLDTAEAAISYVTSLPCLFDIPFRGSAIWDSLYQNTQVPFEQQNARNSFFTSCIGKSTLSNMINKVRDFYRLDAAGELVPLLITRKEIQLDNAGIEGNDCTEELNAYKETLRLRNFPIKDV